jgi:small-conductance mechanosensitive channel
VSLEDLSKANKRADDLALKLEQSEKALEKARSNAAAVEDLRRRLHDAEHALSENIAQQHAHEEDVIARLESQNRRFVSKCPNQFASILSFCLSLLFDDLMFCFSRKDAS